ncbi:MAG TPA: tRNA (adenosine(37)-N6)-dimethylallyltransferase MiaA [Bryobacteraceae bacterium]
MDVPELPPVARIVAITGPTGSGKSDLALALAEEFHGEVINCDSLQVYRHFNLGTAKLSLPERRGIPHHLIDIVDPDELFTAGEYARRARVVLEEISSREKLPIVAGGTGFYLRALLDGLFAGPERDAALRERLVSRERRRTGSLHRILRRLDPAAARNIHPNDVPKLTRALEVCLLTQRRVSELFRAGRDALRGYHILKIGLDPSRDSLYARLDERCRRMFESGLVEEVKHILALGFSAEAKPFESHGYKQALQLLRGELTLKEAIFYAQRNTRRYAKRQMTWFRQERGMAWLKGFGEEPGIRASARELVREYLTN